VIERFFGRIKRLRRVVARHEKKAADHLGFVRFAAIVTTINCLSTRPS
jgi:transposase